MVGVVSVTDRVAALLADAEARAARADWDGAARAWMRVAEMALAEHRVAPAVQTLDAAAEALRRADRPRDAAGALQRALALADEPRLLVRWAGCQLELGRGAAAADAATRALARGEEPIALDTWIGAVFAVGRTAEVRGAVERLVALDATAGAFRTAQLARLDGALDRSDAALAAVPVEHPSAAAAVAGERAENALLRGAAADAVAGFAEAAALHRAAGRLALAWRSEAGQVRATVAAGATPLRVALDEPLREARARGMPLLEADLRLARGVAAGGGSRATPDLQRAAQLADAAGDRLRGGRARLEWAARVEGAPALRERLLTEAVALLADHVLLAERARALRAG